jgi:putative transposon-encoded protein
VVIPESVTEIGSSAFYDCTSLESVVIPESVTEIGSSAFSDCTSLENIYIPKGSIGKFKKMFGSSLWDKLIEV